MASLFMYLLVISALGVIFVKGDGKQNRTYGRLEMFSICSLIQRYLISFTPADINQWKKLYMFVNLDAAHLDLPRKARVWKAIEISTCFQYLRVMWRKSPQKILHPGCKKEPLENNECLITVPVKRSWREQLCITSVADWSPCLVEMHLLYHVSDSGWGFFF